MNRRLFWTRPDGARCATAGPVEAFDSHPTAAMFKPTPQFGGMIDEQYVDTRMLTSMNAGTKFREAVGRGDAMVGLTLGKIRKAREGETPLEGKCFVLRSLKTTKEVETLRRIYRDR